MTTHVDARRPRPFASAAISFRQQAMLLAASGRWIALVLVLLVPLMVPMLRDDVLPQIPLLMIAAVFALPVGVIWAATVWKGETPSRRTYHWSLPVPRPAHDLARVIVGALYLLAAYAVLACAGALVALADGTFERFAAIQPVAWANYILAPLIIYLLVMPNVLWSDYRITRRIYGVAFGGILLAIVLGRIGIGFAVDVLDSLMFASRGLASALWAGMMPELTIVVPGGAPPTTAWWPAAWLWLTVGVVLTLFTATFRPDDLRRRLARR